MNFKTKDTLDNLKANNVGFKFKFINRVNRYEYEYRIDGTGVSSIGQEDFRTSLENAIEFIEDGLWTVIKTSNEHPHADVIRAYADGAKIQWQRCGDQIWIDVDRQPFSPTGKYRIKPDMKTLYKVVFPDGADGYDESVSYYANIEVFKEKNRKIVPIGINPNKFIEVPVTDPDYT